MEPFASFSASSSQQVPYIVHGSGQGCSALVGVPPGGTILAIILWGLGELLPVTFEMRLC
jgi:hypothetical protein